MIWRDAHVDAAPFPMEIDTNHCDIAYYLIVLVHLVSQGEWRCPCVGRKRGSARCRPCLLLEVGSLVCLCGMDGDGCNGRNWRDPSLVESEVVLITASQKRVKEDRQSLSEGHMCMVSSLGPYCCRQWMGSFQREDQTATQSAKKKNPAVVPLSSCNILFFCCECVVLFPSRQQLV